jgi:hypothetical protein
LKKIFKEEERRRMNNLMPLLKVFRTKKSSLGSSARVLLEI